MPTYYDSTGKAHVLAEEIGRGGEGTVYFCQENPELVAKIYYEPIIEEKAEKLRWMAANKNERLLKVAAWVVDVLYEDKEKTRVVGFLMPNVRAKEIHELYSLKSRRVYFPEATWHFLVHTAANVARAFYNLHKYEHVMGDVNHGNCVVLADGTVKLIDCDSYSIKTDKMRYACKVGVVTHLPPELQGKNLSEVERAKKHDNFGLAVIIFQLLFLGRHPFSGNYLGEKDKTLEECIGEYRFAYSKDAKLKKIKQPPGTLSLSEVSPRIAEFFERAFSKEETRPNPREWIEALEDLSNNLEQCSLHPGHHFYQELNSCPWCEIESETGVMLFPFITTANEQTGEKAFNIFTIESLISNLGISRNLPAKLIKPSAVMPSYPTPEILQEQKKFREHKMMIVGAHFVAICVLMMVFGVGSACFFGLILMIFFIVHLNNYDKSISEGIKARFNEAQEKWEQLKAEWDQGAVPPKLDDELARIKKKIHSYQKLQKDSIRDLKLLREETARRHFNKYLLSHRLENSHILGVKDEQRLELVKKGVVTAAKIEEDRLRHFHNIEDDYLIKRLLRWREELENNYEPEEDIVIPETEKRELLEKTATKRRKIEKDIESILGSLRSGSVYLKKKQRELVKKSEDLAKELTQAESNMKTLGDNSYAIAYLVLITFVAPLLGTIFGGFGFDNPSPRVLRVDDSSYSRSDDGTGYGSADTDWRPQQISPEEYELPDENITDDEIAELSVAKRAEYAENLYQISANLSSNADQTNNQTGYKNAENKIRLAIRMDKDNIKYLNHLGFILYQQGNHDESLKYLKQALELDEDNYGTQVTIGINYLKMERYKDARRTFSGLISGTPTLEAYFNLGLAYSGLKDYDSAAKQFRKAVEIDPSDADSHHELGYALYKKGDKEGAYGQYYILEDLDEGLAERLRTSAKLFDVKPRKKVATGTLRAEPVPDPEAN